MASARRLMTFHGSSRGARQVHSAAPLEAFKARGLEVRWLPDDRRKITWTMPTIRRVYSTSNTARGLSEPPTMQQTLTGEHTILGTVQYPEQAQGKPADARSDIFAFGLAVRNADGSTPV